jgi:hypothetical protein
MAIKSNFSCRRNASGKGCDLGRFLGGWTFWGILSGQLTVHQVEKRPVPLLWTSVHVCELMKGKRSRAQMTRCVPELIRVQRIAYHFKHISDIMRPFSDITEMQRLAEHGKKSRHQREILVIRDRL